MNIILKYFLHLTSIIIVCALMVSYNQPSYVSQVLTAHYESCTDINITFTETIRCIRQGHGRITEHYDLSIRPILSDNFFTWIPMMINDVCVLFKNYLLIIVPVMMMSMYRTNIKKILGLYINSVILCIGWNYLYRYIISSIMRTIFQSNISGHIIILPIILSYLIVIFFWFLTESHNKNSNVSLSRRLNTWTSYFMGIVILFLMIHVIFTCLFFHTFIDVLLGGIISYIITYVIVSFHIRIYAFFVPRESTINIEK